MLEHPSLLLIAELGFGLTFLDPERGFLATLPGGLCRECSLKRSVQRTRRLNTQCQ